jgi:hypothetical protein
LSWDRTWAGMERLIRGAMPKSHHRQAAGDAAAMSVSQLEA